MLDEFVIVEVENGNWFFHTFDAQEQFQAWRNLPENRTKYMIPRGQVSRDSKARYARRKRAYDEDHSLDFHYDW